MLIQSLSDCNETLTNNHLVRKLTLNHLAKPKFEHIKYIFLLKSRACIKYFSQKTPQKTQPTNQPNKQTKKPASRMHDFCHYMLNRRFLSPGLNCMYIKI